MSNTITLDTASEVGLKSEQVTLGLMIAWSQAAPERVGQLLLPWHSSQPHVVGRGDEPAAGFVRLLPITLRPGQLVRHPPLQDPRLSREQLAIYRQGAQGLRLRNLGRRAMALGGRVAEEAEVRAGDIIALHRCMVLLCVRVPPGQAWEETPPGFACGQPDRSGIIGESPEIWALREQLERIAGSTEHVLILGESGVGKELAARALHRTAGPFVSRSAATLPEGLIDAELFGNMESYPQAGMAARPGLVGAADGGTLFLDEIAELPEAMQSRLLRVLDQGEYHRLGESRARSASFRLIAATNRPEDRIKHDLLARIPYRLRIPSLNDRRQDIPLLIPHLLRQSVSADPALQRFYPPGSPHPRLSAALVCALLSRHYTTNIRELRALLLNAALLSRETLELSAQEGEGWQAWVGRSRDTIPPEALQAALDAHNGSIEATWRALGLSSRHVLRRLIQRHGLTISRSG